MDKLYELKGKLIARKEDLSPLEILQKVQDHIKTIDEVLEVIKEMEKQDE